jgi:2-keto-4-pentenoate hydratase/2-oxohepta-3-ene-1,7-dioic acid hydratase in catechol pathway
MRFAAFQSNGKPALGLRLDQNFDRSGAFGPEFVTLDELPSGATGLKLQTRLNGQVLQEANTRDMIFDVATLVSVCSEPFALQPGDIIIAGTRQGWVSRASRRSS